jgi:DNA-directed RNA polymerase I, II, and III subunit RPABC3
MDRIKLIDDTIHVTAINREGKFFEKVSRIEAKSEVNKFDIELDVNTDIYPMEVDSYYALALATSLNQDGSEDFDVLTYINQGEGVSSLLDQYQYVVHGKIFKYNIAGQKV